MVELLSKDSEYELIRKAQAGDIEALSVLILSYRPLLKNVAMRFYTNFSKLSLDDLINVGVVGLINAVYNFDFNKKTRLSTYAMPKIRYQIKKALFHMTPLRVPYRVQELAIKIKNDNEKDLDMKRLAKKYKVCSKEIKKALDFINMTEFNLNDDAFEIGEDLFKIYEIKEMVNKCLGCLSKREKIVIQKLFGLPPFESETLQEIGNELNLSAERIRQIKNKAIEKMRNFLGLERKKGIL